MSMGYIYINIILCDINILTQSNPWATFTSTLSHVRLPSLSNLMSMGYIYINIILCDITITNHSYVHGLHLHQHYLM